ncbi:hypothetical protein [Streptomyces sp. NPDC092295]|uniref:hypothetical protein n=1 Tax=Streptomyces sp. NPDC092295 TaxID=3366011 RepID=UPI003810C85C
MSKTYSRDEVDLALNAGADLVIDGLDLGERDGDLKGLIISAVLTVLDAPRVDDLDEVLRRNYTTPPEEVRDWWGGWA